MQTTAQLRDTIDRGRAKDKVDFPDPAAAPLGTDDEAAGTPPTEAELKLADQGQVSASRPNAPHDTHERMRGPSGTSHVERGWSVAAKLSIVIVAVFVAAILLISQLAP